MKALPEDRRLGAVKERGRLGWLELLEREEERGAPFSVGTAAGVGRMGLSAAGSACSTSSPRQ
jgi:hypothetical protein